MMDISINEKMSEENLFIDTLVQTYDELSQRKDLRPCVEVDFLFSELVGTCIKILNQMATKKILRDPRVTRITPSLRRLCAIAEGHLESHWAKVILDTSEQKGFRQLELFPYYDNYVDLTRMELAAIQSVDASPLHRIAFLGSGPLPLSSLCLCSMLNPRNRSWLSYIHSFSHSRPTTIVNIDHDPKAILESRELCRKLGPLACGMDFVCKSAEDTSLDLKEFDAVYLAALVGCSQEEKEKVLIGVVGKMRENALLIVRTAHGLRTLLYPEFNAASKAVLACLDICLVVHPFNHIVNSVIIARVKRKL